ncbi:MAG: TerC family protein [Planctomycetota bacterium JB042]
MDWLADPELWAAFLTLTALEIVLGIDNIVFLSILASKLPPEDRGRARRLGLLGAMGMRILLLFSLAWMVRLTAPFFSILGQEISGRDLILIGGGLFLIAKSTREIHLRLRGHEEAGSSGGAAPSFRAVLIQIALLDAVFSLDSVITAVGMVDDVAVMVAAVVCAVLVMMAAAGPIAAFVERHPTVKMLALSFLLMIGVLLVADGLDHHIPKGYVYFAMAFSVGVEALNLRASKADAEPVKLRSPYDGE